MMTIIFESHSTTLDNEAHKASGWFDVELSSLGEQQAIDLGYRYQQMHFDGIFCSDLQRSYKTAELAFSNRNLKIFKDPRLRECNFGQYTRYPIDKIEKIKIDHINHPFSNGESYEDVIKRMNNFLIDLVENYSNGNSNSNVMIIGHRATQYGLDHLINKIPIQDAVNACWKWQPGWTYHLDMN